MNRNRTILYPSLLLACLLSTPGTNAQFTRIGGGLTFSPGIDNVTHETGNPGFNARGVFEFGENFWGVPSLTFYMPKTRTDQYSGFSRRTLFGSVDLNMTYTLATESSLLFYGLAGLNLTFLHSRRDDPAQEDIFEPLPGLNLGTGVEMIVQNDINAVAQIKYVVGPAPSQYLVISVGVHYYPGGRRFKHW